MADWDPDNYLRLEDHRTRPAAELAAHVRVTAPETVIDLGCGPGNSTQVLRQRWPGQCLVYASQFEFACCVLVDTSKDKKLVRAYHSGVAERYIIDKLWQDFNVRLAVV